MTENLRKRTASAIAIVALQAIGATYFLLDGIEDIIVGFQTRITLSIVMESIVATGLVLGVALGGRYVRRLLGEARHQQTALEAARGEMSALIERRFAEWGLSRSEAEVALFALKGSSIGEIAAMRKSAEGTVRSQLSQIYAKAGVKNQPGLVATFIDDLIDPLIAAAVPPVA